MPVFECKCKKTRSQFNPAVSPLNGSMCRNCHELTSIVTTTPFPFSYGSCGSGCGCIVAKGTVAYCYAKKADFGTLATTTTPAPAVIAKPARANVKPRFIIPHFNDADHGKCTAGKKYECLSVSSYGVADYIGDDGRRWAISSLQYTPVYDDEPVKTKATGCDCGAAKCGYGPGINHSHWNHPNDKSKWCPLRVE